MAAPFSSHLRVRHSSRIPTPILPIDYGFFLIVPLASKVADAPVQEQLAMAQSASERRRAYPYRGPFQEIVAFEFRPTERLSIYLNADAKFDGGGPDLEQNKMNLRNEEDAEQPLERYVIGLRKDGFSWFLPTVEGEAAADQDLCSSRQFSSLMEAVSISTEHGANVFELLDEGENLSAQEISVDLAQIGTAPFLGGYWLMDKLAIGPTPLCFYGHDTEQRIRGLRRAGVRRIVSLMDHDELLWSHDALTKPWLEEFEHHLFPFPNGGVPSRRMMKLTLDVIDDSIQREQTTYVHCHNGLGRSGLVAACYAARHGVASGQAILNFITRRRMQYGLFEPSPENERQCEFVRTWEKGK